MRRAAYIAALPAVAGIYLATCAAWCAVAVVLASRVCGSRRRREDEE